MRILSTFLLLLLVPGRALADERWFIFSIGDTPVGWVSEHVDGLKTRTTVSARLTRLGQSIDMRFETTTTEDAAGALQILGYEAVLSKQPMRVEARVDGERIRIVTPPHERVVERGADAVLGPIAVARLTAGRLHAAGDRVEYAVFSPELQRVARVRRVLVAVSERHGCGPCVSAGRNVRYRKRWRGHERRTRMECAVGSLAGVARRGGRGAAAADDRVAPAPPGRRSGR